MAQGKALLLLVWDDRQWWGGGTMSYQNIDLWNLKAEKNLINPIFQGFFFFFFFFWWTGNQWPKEVNLGKMVEIRITHWSTIRDKILFDRFILLFFSHITRRNICDCDSHITWVTFTVTSIQGVTWRPIT